MSSMTNAAVLTGLRQYADDKEFQKKWRAIKHANKERLAAKIKVWRPSLTSVTKSLSQNRGPIKLLLCLMRLTPPHKFALCWRLVTGWIYLLSHLQL
jgi:hypothetical protein